MLAEFSISRTLQARILEKARIYMALGVFYLGCCWLTPLGEMPNLFLYARLNEYIEEYPSVYATSVTDFVRKSSFAAASLASFRYAMIPTPNFSRKRRSR